MSDQIKFRHFMEGDEEQITKLMEIAFHKWPRFDLECTSKAHWIWKFREPANQTNTVVVAENHNREIIGINQAQVKKTKIGSKIVLARKTTEVAVHPEYRGKGVHKQLAIMGAETSKTKGADFSYSLSTNPVVVNYKKKESEYSKFPHPIKQLVKIQNINKFIHYWREHKETKRRENFTLKIGIHALKHLNTLNKVIQPSKKPDLKFRIQKIYAFDEKMKTFWENMMNNYDFIIEKSKEHLNWRYHDPRGGNYEVFTAEEQNILLGYIALRVNRVNPNHPVGYIMELLSLSDREDVAEALVNYADTYFTNEKVNAIYFTVVSGHPYEKLLSKYGFIDSRRRPLVYYRIYRNFETLENFINAPPERLHYQFGEFDSI
jgi:predicted N-acetyltransferase YhbS